MFSSTEASLVLFGSKTKGSMTLSRREPVQCHRCPCTSRDTALCSANGPTTARDSSTTATPKPAWRRPRCTCPTATDSFPWGPAITGQRHVSIFVHVQCLDVPVVVLLDRFYAAPFSALEQTHCALVACDFQWVNVDVYGAFLISTEVVYSRRYLVLTWLALRKTAAVSACSTMRQFTVWFWIHILYVGCVCV